MLTAMEKSYAALYDTGDARPVTPDKVLECSLWAGNGDFIGIRDVTVQKSGRCVASAGGKRVTVTVENDGTGWRCIARDVTSYRHGKYRAIATFSE